MGNASIFARELGGALLLVLTYYSYVLCDVTSDSL